MWVSSRMRSCAMSFSCHHRLHTHGMTVRQSEKMFLEVPTRIRHGATAALRGTYDPAYLNYTLGKLMIRKLRADWVAQQTSATRRRTPSRTGRLSRRLPVLRRPPIPLVRKAMVGDKDTVLRPPTP